MEQFRKIFPVAGAVITTAVSVIVAARQIGVSGILVAIISTIIAAAALGVLYYLQFNEQKRHDRHNPGGSQDKEGPTEGRHGRSGK
jgi:hypothetical protein